MRITIALFAFLVATDAWATDDVDAVTAELEQAGELDDAGSFKQQLRNRLRDVDSACAGEEQAACQQRLRQQVRAAHRVGKQSGRIENAADAAAVASAIMMMAGDGGDADSAGELVQEQLRHEWRAEQVGEAAQQMRQLRHRWRHQTMKMVGACVGEGSCTPEDARVAVRSMKAASQRADLDPRRVGRMVRAAIAEHAEQRAEGGEQLQTRLRKRLRLKGEGGVESTVGSGEQRRTRYRRQMDGEGRRGGQYGGNASSGPGQGTKPRGGRF